MKSEIHAHRSILPAYVLGRDTGEETIIRLMGHGKIILKERYIKVEDKGGAVEVEGVDTEWWTIMLWPRTTVLKSKNVTIVADKRGTIVEIDTGNARIVKRLPAAVRTRTAEILAEGRRPVMRIRGELLGGVRGGQGTPRVPQGGSGEGAGGR